MRRVVIIGSNDPDGWSSVMREATRQGLTIVQDEKVGKGDSPDSIRIIDYLPDAAHRERLMNSTIRNLLHLQEFTAYQAWQMLGGLLSYRDNSTRLTRGAGQVFRTACRLMIAAEISFADLDPYHFTHYHHQQWERTHGMPVRLANILGRVELFDPWLLAQVSDEEIKHFGGVGTTMAKQLIAIRDGISAEPEL